MNIMKITMTICAVSLLIPSSAFGWVLPIYNKLSYAVQASVEYPGCRTDVVSIAPGGQSNVDAKGCLVNRISVTVSINDKDRQVERIKQQEQSIIQVRSRLHAISKPRTSPAPRLRRRPSKEEEQQLREEEQKRREQEQRRQEQSLQEKEKLSATLAHLESEKVAIENEKAVNQTVNLDWRVPGHRDFSISIDKLPNGTIGIQAKYGDQLWTQVGSAFQYAAAEVKKGVEIAAAETKKGFEIAAAETKKGFEIAGQEIKKGVEIAAAETKKAFETAGQEIKKGFEDFGTIIEKKVLDPIVAAGDDVLSRLKDCAETVALGSEWAAKKAAYEGALAGLAATQEINKSEPFTFAIQATKVAALAGLDAGKLGAQALSAILEGLGTIIGGGFNITEVSFDAQAQDLAEGKLPMFNIKGVFLGKSCDLKFQFDVTKPDKSMEAVVKELIKVIPGV